MPRKQKKYHFIYRTTNLLNEKFYVGMHSTDNLDDGYFGSGKRLGYSVRKYGLENHKFEILEFLPSREELKKREAEVVNAELLTNPQCMNLKFGGEGGWDHTKNMDLKSRNTKCNQRFVERFEDDKEFREAFILAGSKNLESGRIKKKEIHGNNNFWLGQPHKDSTKNKISKSMSAATKGEANSQFGTCWICNDVEVKKIKKEELQTWLDQGWRKGRK